jgi:hypothetical protein
MGFRGAGRIRIFAEMTALRGQSTRAQRGRRLDQTLSRVRYYRARRASRPPALAIRAVQEIRRSRLRRFSRTTAEHIRRPYAAPRHRGASRQLQDAGFHRSAPQIWRRRRLCRARHLLRDCRHHRRLRVPVRPPQPSACAFTGSAAKGDCAIWASCYTQRKSRPSFARDTWHQTSAKIFGLSKSQFAICWIKHCSTRT